jgi:hypothetical protein
MSKGKNQNIRKTQSAFKKFEREVRIQMWQRFLNQKYLLLIFVLATVSGCLSPETIRHVAEDNSQNISNYNINVAAVANALRREAALHGEIQIQLARNKLAGELIQLPQKWLGAPKPTSLTSL